jgi:hypothetical protein
VRILKNDKYDCGRGITFTDGGAEYFLSFVRDDRRGVYRGLSQIELTMEEKHLRRQWNTRIGIYTGRYLLLVIGDAVERWRSSFDPAQSEFTGDRQSIPPTVDRIEYRT